MNRVPTLVTAQRIAVLLVTVALVVISIRADAAYRILRPIAIGTYGYINQTNLYGENSWVHKGIDFPAVLDTSVYAVADGVVRQVVEDYEDNCHPWNEPPEEPVCPAFGNFILVRHNQPHYDRMTGQTAYVYALYAHLSRFGANVNVNDPISAGQDIGDVDNTGNSYGNHLHLQIMIDPDPNRTITYPLSWSETKSRNPELWLTPYNGTTGTVVGKVTNTNGDPVGGRYICGLQKQPSWGYGWNVTYNDPSLNPDDILVENWGTTDVTPGTYEVRSCPPGTCTSNCISMGTHG
jgi:murein DD-endopeptidase MepM/ murein hydrolase activator NlpD